MSGRLTTPWRGVMLGLFLTLGGIPGLRAQEDTVPAVEPPAGCAEGPAGERRGGVDGRVLDSATSLALPGATVRAEPVRSADDSTDAAATTVVSDSAGRYRICHLTVGASVTLRATRFSTTTPDVRVWIPRDGLARQDFSIELGQPGRLLGRVTDRATSEPVESATLTLAGLGVTALTDRRGRFHLPPAPPGTYELRVEHVAYGTVSDTVTLVAGRTVSLDARVEQRPIEVAPLEVAVDAVRPRWLEDTGFYHRRDLEHGTFFSPDQLEEEDPHRLSDLFRGISGIRVRGGRLTITRSPRSLVTGDRCPLQFFVNGGMAMLPAGIDTFTPRDVAAIEVYKGPSEVPMEFSKGRSVCGAVVVWLRVDRD